MALITIPDVRAPQMTMSLIRGSIPVPLIGGGTVIAEPPFALWRLQFPLVTQKLPETRAWFVALVQLSKLSNTFKIKPPAWFPGAGYGGPDPVVDGAGQLGLSVACRLATPSVTVALAGDFVEVDVNGFGEFKLLTQDAVSDGAGLVTFNFEPALRDSPLDGAVVKVKTPQVTMRLINPQAEWSAKLPSFYDISLECVEQFGPQG